MSIGTEVARIRGAKAGLKASIESKGVAVPTATRIGGYPALVDQISGGGPATTLTIVACDAQGYPIEVLFRGVSDIPPAICISTTDVYQTSSGWRHLKKIDFSSSLRTIGSHAFRGCANLSDVDETQLQSAVNYGQECFRLCSSLQLTKILNPAAEIGELAFGACTSIKTIKLRVKKIGGSWGGAANSFAGCSLTHIWLAKEIQTILNQSGAYPFASNPAECVIYTDVASAGAVPSGWGSFWNFRSASEQYTVIYGTSEAEFDAIAAEVQSPAVATGAAQSDFDTAVDALNLLGVKTHGF